MDQKNGFVKNNVEENVLAGMVGAFLFSLAGGILWYVLYQIGFIASISAIIGVIAAIKGYSFFSKKESLKGIIIAVVIALIVIVIAWYLCLSTDVYLVYGEWFASGEIDYEITFADAVWGSYNYLFDAEVGPSYWGDLAIGVVLGAIGCIQPIRSALSRSKRSQD